MSPRIGQMADEDARRAKPDDLCAACSVPRSKHGEDGRTKHWFVLARASVVPATGETSDG